MGRRPPVSVRVRPSVRSFLYVLKSPSKDLTKTVLPFPITLPVREGHRQSQTVNR